MISQNSIFIIGAGSSKQYGYPLWWQLKQEILTYLELPEIKNDPHADEAKHWLEEVTDAKTLDQVISERNKDIQAKHDPSKTEAMIWTAIATVFFELEQKVVAENRKGWIDLYAEYLLSIILKSYEKVDDDWNMKLLATAAQQLEKTYFITFNYDRLLEYKISDNLLESIDRDINNKNEFGLKINKGMYAILKDKIYHPHGIINPYDGLDDNSVVQKDRHNGNISKFGVDANSVKHLLKFSPGLMASCFDCKDEVGSFSDLRNKNVSPEEIYILGNSVYGLAKNIVKLPCKQWSASVKRIICTSFNENHKDAYKGIILGSFERDIDITFYETCAQFAEKEIPISV